MNQMIDPVVNVRLDGHDRRINKHDVDIDLIKNRLPSWATVLLSILTAIIGATATALIH